MLGKTYALIIIISFICGIFTGNITKIGEACATGAVGAIKFMLEFGALMAFWCGIMSVFESIGILKIVSKAISPLLKIVFPNSYKKNAGIEEISMNVSANLLGLGNAATPMGIRAMEKMKEKLVNTDDMIMLTVLNTASIQIIPTTLISLRMLANSPSPYEILVPIWITSTITVIFAILITKVLGLIFKEKEPKWKK